MKPWEQNWDFQPKPWERDWETGTSKTAADVLDRPRFQSNPDIISGGPEPEPEGVGPAFRILGRSLVGGLGDLGNLVTGQSYEGNTVAGLRNDEMPAEEVLRNAPLPIRIPGRAAQGLIETAPKIAAVAGMQAGGIPAPVAAATVFGFNDEGGFSPTDAAVAAAIPYVGKYSGEITAAIAKRFGVNGNAALKLFRAAGGTTGAAAYLGTIQESQIEQLPPDQRHQARIEALAANLGQLGLGVMAIEKTPLDKSADEFSKAVSSSELPPTEVRIAQREQAVSSTAQGAGLEPGIIEPERSTAPEGAITPNPTVENAIKEAQGIRIAEPNETLSPLELLRRQTQQNIIPGSDRVLKESQGGKLPPGEQTQSVAETPGFLQTAEQRIGKRTAFEPTLESAPSDEESASGTPLQTVQEKLTEKLAAKDLQGAVELIRGQPTETQQKLVNEATGVTREKTPLRAAERTIFNEIWEQQVEKGRRGIISGSAAEQWADKIISKSGERLRSGFDPELAAAGVVKGAAILERGIRGFAEWSREMIKHFGETVRPHLRDLYWQSSQLMAQKAPHLLLPSNQSGRTAQPPSRTLANQPAGSQPRTRPGPIRSAIQSLNTTRQQIAALLASGKVREAMAKTRDAGDNRAANTGLVMSNDIRGPLRRQFPQFYTVAQNVAREFTRGRVLPEDALSFAVEAQGDPLQLNAFEQKIANSPDASPKWQKRSLEAIAFARQHWNELRPMADAYGAITEWQLRAEHAVGVDTPKRNGYVMHAQDINDRLGFGSIMRGGGGDSTEFRKMREHATFADSIAAGVDPKSLNAVDLLNARVRVGQRIINRNLWGYALRGMVDPTNGQPIAQQAKRITTPAGVDQFDIPQGYTLEFLGNKPLAVQNGYSGIFKALTAPDALAAESLYGAIQRANATGKSLALFIDTFHLCRIAIHQSVIKAAGITTFEAPIPFTHRRGLLLSDYSTAEIMKMAHAGEIPRRWLGDIIRQKNIVDLVSREGINNSGVSDALHQDWIHDAPLIGAYNRFLFEKFQRGAVNELAVLEFDRQRGMYPKLSDAEVARKVAKELNTRFGNFQRQGIFKSATGRNLMRLSFLAPQWNEGLIKTELGAILQAPQAVIDSIQGRRLASGLLLRSVGSLLVASFAANQLINYYTRGHPTWENPEEGLGAKLSAFIPDKLGAGSGFFLHPAGIAAEITHLITQKFEKNGGDWRKALESFWRSRTSAISKIPLLIATGKNSALQNVKPSDMVSEALKELPWPIPAQPALAGVKQLASGQNQEAFPGQIQKQLMASAGMKTDLVPSPEQRIGSLARDWNKSHSVSFNPQLYPGDYRKLTDALRAGNVSVANRELADLLKSKKPQDVYKYYRNWPNHPFTGSKAREDEFLSSLKPEQKKAYTAALDQRSTIAGKALDMLDKLP